MTGRIWTPPDRGLFCAPPMGVGGKMLGPEMVKAFITRILSAARRSPQ